MTTTISGSNGIVFPDATSMQTGQQAVKAWVHFKGTGTVAIRAGYGVASITDNAVGDYTVNFTTAMVDSNYTVCASGMRDSTYANDANTIIVGLKSNTGYSSNMNTGSFSITTHLPSNAVNSDPIAVCVTIFR